MGRPKPSLLWVLDVIPLAAVEDLVRPARDAELELRRCTRRERCVNWLGDPAAPRLPHGYDVIATTTDTNPTDPHGIKSNLVTDVPDIAPNIVPKPKGFAIGMFGVECTNDPAFMPYNHIPFADATFGGHNSSDLNILSQDGFNLVHDYNANWCNLSLRKFLILCDNNGMKLLAGGGYYNPNSPTIIKNPGRDHPNTIVPPRYGSNVYDCGGLGSNDPNESIWKPRPNIVSLFRYVCCDPALKDIVWGHQLSEEAAYFHYQWHGVHGDSLVLSEIPPDNVFDAVISFRWFTSGLAQRLVVMDANHGKSIYDNTTDGDGYYYVPEYIRGARYDTFFEGSYENFPTDCLGYPYSNIYNNGYHYLGFLKSIDYVLQHVPEVHKVIAIYYDPANAASDPLRFHLYLGPTGLNAAWLWFQAYASIVHGATGIWFWWLREAWRPNETKPAANSPDYFEHLPACYTNYVAPLARELRYLLNQGFLNPNQSTLVHSKTDSPDGLGIVPSPTNYVFPQSTVDNTHMTEQYGIRYAIRSSGQHAIMIAVNPLPRHVQVTFNLVQAQSCSTAITRFAARRCPLRNDIRRPPVGGLQDLQDHPERARHHYPPELREHRLDETYQLLVW